MIREFQYRRETFRVNAHGIAGHEEVFIIHLVDDEDLHEISIDRMTDENDTSARRLSKLPQRLARTRRSNHVVRPCVSLM